MDRESFGSKLRAALLTILAVWAALILAGLAGLRLQPSMAGALISLAVYLALLVAWGVYSRAGRRIGLAVYLLAMLLYWLASTALFILMPVSMMTGWLDWLGVGMTVGLQSSGGPDTPGMFYLVPMVANLFGPILIMAVLRHWARPAGDG